MRAQFKKWYHETFIGRHVFAPFIYIRDRVLPKTWQAKLAFRRVLGYGLNLNNPQTFNEKIQWLKFNERSLLLTQCADKWEVRKYVASKIGEQYLIPVVFQSYNSEDILEENFPDTPFIIKTNHDSSGGIIVRSKQEINWKKLRRTMKKRLRNNYYYVNGEWQYKNIIPCILAEELLTDDNGEIPVDFKFFCFNGKVEFIQLDLDRESGHKRNMYDAEWNLLPFEYAYPNGRHFPKPVLLDEMIDLVNKIAVDFAFVRVDLYNIGGKIYFGEITFHPESGIGKFSPESWDHKFGKLLLLPTDLIPKNSL